MNTKIILGLIGRKQTGKDTVAGLLVRECGYTQLAFADTLRDVALGTNPLVSTDPSIYYADALETYGYEGAKERFPEFRRFLQRLGTEGIRKVDPDFWINQTIKRIQTTDTHVVLTDVRFFNEIQVVKDLGGTTARVYRTGYSDIPAEHESESELDHADTDYLIRNDNGLDLLYSHVYIMHKHLLAQTDTTS